MSYTNQRDHPLLDRQLVRVLLERLRDATVEVAGGAGPRGGRLDELARACDSDLEREWLRLLERHELRLPSHAQKLIASCSARPDFLYAGEYTAVWVDGPAHDTPAQREADDTVDRCLEDLGYISLRFRHDRRDGWLGIARQHPSVFGEPR